MTSFIYREYRDRSNVGYGTLLAMFYLVVIVIALTGLMRGLQPLDAALLVTDRRSFRDSDSDLAYRARWWTSRAVIYGVLILWAIVCIFPIYWTITTSFKMAPDVMQGHLVPFLDFEPAWLGWRSLGLSPDTIGADSTVRDEFLSRFTNSLIVSVTASTLAVILGSLTGYGLSRYGYRFGYMRNADISFFFISQLILPPVVLALPFLVLYKQLGLLDTHLGLVLRLHADRAAHRHLDHARPVHVHPHRAGGGRPRGRPGRLGRLRPDHPAHRAAGHGGGVRPVAGADLERVLLRVAADHDQRQDAAGDGGEPDGQPGHLVVDHGGHLVRGHPAADRRRACCSSGSSSGACPRARPRDRPPSPASPRQRRTCAQGDGDAFLATRRASRRSRSPSYQWSPSAARAMSTPSGTSACIRPVSPSPA